MTLAVDTSLVKVGVSPPHLVGPPPALAAPLLQFTREVSDLLRSSQPPIIPFFHFIPIYYKHFAKQCIPQNFGFKTLRELSIQYLMSSKCLERAPRCLSRWHTRLGPKHFQMTCKN